MDVVKRILTYLRPVLGRFIVALICMAGVAAISTGIVWLMKYIVDTALAAKDMESLKNGVFLLLCAIGLKSILWYTHTYLTSYVSQVTARGIRNDSYKHLYSLSMGFFNEKASGTILARLTNDISTLQQALTSAPTVVLRDGLSVLGLIGYLFYSNWKFASISFLVLPVAGYVLVTLGKKSRSAGRESQSRMAELYNIVHEALAAMPIVKVFQSEKREIQEFERENHRYFEIMMKLVRVDARSSPIMESIGAVVLAFLLIIGGRDVINGVWSIGSFIAFMGAAMSLYNPIKKFASVNVQLQQGLASAERVFELLDQKGTVNELPNAVEVPTIQRDITFKDVSFSYPGSNVVLDSVNLTVKKGDIVALVGASGSGKTTLAQLVLRFYDPISGVISIDGKDLRSISLHSLRKQMAVVTQETHLFNDTIEANIAYGRPEATTEEIHAAAKAAYAHDFISALPKGYQTVIGERGVRVSGGEKQRLAIARSILKNPAILILDEATSALDTASEQMVQQALDRLLTGRTVLMIAHRLSTVRKADHIVVLEKGKIKEIGSHEDLIKQKGAYHRLYELQSIG